jgi:hypothetical protein
MIGTYFLNPVNLPFEGSRPVASSSVQLSLAESQDVDARLWQDPFAAIWKDADRQSKSERKTGCHAGPNCLTLASDGEALILGVMLPGSPYPESEELRRQVRYAILSSLGTSNYVPADPEHIGYFGYGVDRPRDTAPEMPANVSTKIAFEEFLLPAAPAADKIFVLWINEDELATMAKGCPIDGLSALKSKLLAGNPASARKVVFLGPFASTTLNAMVAEADQNGKCPAATQDKDLQSGGRLTLYNFAATADEELFKPRGYPDLGSFFQAKAGVRYYRTIADDSQLAHIITDELKKRSVDPQRDPSDHVLLVSEWDSFYGRTLPTSLIRAFMGGAACPSQAASPAQQFHCFNYMRGLDGQLPEAPASNSKDGAGTGKQDTQSVAPRNGPDQILANFAPSESIERPYGNGQYDYLRRLGFTIQQLDDRIRKDGTGKISAVGVVGSDVYDKLIILQLLRPQFPQAVFFTTDLDARLYHPAEAEGTRNLIVASAFGLELAERWQGHIPPFRTSYQTSAFLTTQLVLDDRKKGPPQSYPEWVKHPMLFQIPYRGLFAFALPTEEVQRASSQAKACPPPRPPFAPVMRSCSMVSPPIAELFPRPSNRRGSFVGGTVLIGAIFFGVGLASSRWLRSHLTGAQTASGSRRKKIWSDRAHFLLLLALLGTPLVIAWPAMREVLTWNGPPEPILLIGASSIIGGFTASRRVLGFVTCRKVKNRTESTYLLPMLAVFLVSGALYYLAWPTIGTLLTSNGDGEPILFLSGLSLWPSIFIRLFNILFGVWLIGYGVRKLDRNFNAIADAFQLPALDPAGADSVLRRIWKTLYLSRLRHYIDMFSYRVRDHEPCQIEDLWTSYRDKEQAWARLFRVGVATLATGLLFVMLIAIFGNPQPTTRGAGLQMFNWILSWIEGAVIWFLIFFVADTTLYCARFVSKIRRVNYEWPDRTLTKYAKAFNLHKDYLDDWIDMEFIAERTDCINKLVYLPFMMLALLIVSRSSVFDYFPPNWPVLSMTTLGFLIVMICALALPWEAEEERRTAIRKLSECLINIKGEPADSPSAKKEPATGKRAHPSGAESDQVAAGKTWKAPKPDQIEALLHRVEQLSKGAFTPFTQQPVGWALLLPLSGLGGTALLQYFALAGF